MDPHIDELREILSDQRRRLETLYKITNKDGQIVPFKPNKHQWQLYEGSHNRNVILKARQLGMTTFLAILALDFALFTDSFGAGFIAHNKDDAGEIFAKKIMFAYDRLPDDLRLGCPIVRSNQTSYVEFDNGSSIRVGTSMRSGTVQFLHVSEMGKIAAKYPEKAAEIVSGAFEAVPKNGRIFVESTAEGREGAFYDLCESAQRIEPETALDFKFHFFPWWAEPNYTLDIPIGITDRMAAYFDSLRQQGIDLTPEQQWWYVKKEMTLGEMMTREHPSTPEEAFMGSVEGSYWREQMKDAWQTGRIGDYPVDPRYPVNTFWDLGINDTNAIWFHQYIDGRDRLVHYYENTDKTMDFYADYLERLMLDNRLGTSFKYGKHYLPHDVEKRELGVGNLRQHMMKLGIKPIKRVERPNDNNAKIGQINAVRDFLRTCQIDRTHCEEGIKHLENYKREWDEKHSVFSDRPSHDQASHGADALRTGVIGFKPETGYIQTQALGVRR